MNAPSKYCVEVPLEHGVVQNLVRPAPKYSIRLVVEPQELAGTNGRLTNADRQRIRSHPVLYSEHASFELVPFRFVRVLRRLWRYRARLLRKGEIGIAGDIGVHH